MRPLRHAAGAVLLLGAAGLAGHRLRVERAEWPALAAAGFCNVLVFNLCTALGQSLMATSQAAIIAFTMPVWATLLAIPMRGFMFLTRPLLKALNNGANRCLRRVGVEAVDVNVAISAYLVTVAVLIPATGWLADRFGIRRVFLAAIVVFTVASAGCALSTSLPLLIGMRVLQGGGGAMMVAVGRLAVLRASSKADLVRAIALLTWPALAAPVLAPAIGGAIATAGGWRWIFIVNIPLGVIGFALALRLIRGGPAAEPGRLDWPGLLLLGTGIAAALIALESIRLSGTDWLLVGACGFGAVVLLVSAVRHLLSSAAPLIRLPVLRVRTLRLTVTSDRDGKLFDGQWIVEEPAAPSGILFGNDLNVNFQTTGVRTLTLTARYGTQVVTATKTVYATNTPPELELETFGEPQEGEPFIVTANITDINEPSLTDICNSVTWEVQAPDTVLPRGSSMAKLKATETARRVALDAMQMMGGYGYTTEFDMERLVRSSIVSTVYGGASEIQREIIAKTYGLSEQMS